MRHGAGWVVFFAMAICALAQSSGGIQGVISDDSRLPVMGAYVIATPLGTAGGVNSTVQSGPGGQYSFTQLAAGNYMICVQVPHSRYLDTCYWSTPTQATVTAGKISGNVNVRLTSGALLHVRLNDPGQHVAKGEGVVLLGVVGPSSLFHPLSVVTSNDSGALLDFAIPLNSAARLAVNSDRLQITDGIGAPLAAISNSLPIPQAAVQNSPLPKDPFLIFNLTGKRP